MQFKYEVVKKTVYDKLIAKVNNIGTSGFVLKTKYNEDKSVVKKKISDADKKFLILVDLLKKQITILRLVKQKVKYLALVVWLRILH